VYPGQYKRLVKSVRVTMPGVVGPYTTVGAKLTMTAGSLRPSPTSALAATTPQPNIASAIATSTGVGDSGVFDLTFRDERYLPFEGAGAVSSWRLELPGQLRSFDYGTISDVVMHLSYTALDDDAFRTTVENSIVNSLKKTAQSNGLFRLLSLRFDFPAAYAQLTGPTAPANTSTTFAMDAARFPYFLSSTTLDLTSAQLYLVGQGTGPVTTTGLTMSVNGTTASAWTTDPATGLPTATVPLSGALVGNWTVAVPSGHVDPAKIADVLLLVKYKTA
jgi:receptor-binding and translocation channel-forming TcA subunit of Tc toxin